MCSLAPPTALGFGFHAAGGGGRASLGRRCGAAPAGCGAMARAFSEPGQKRSRDGKIRKREGFAGGGEAPVVPATVQQRRLQERMREELDAIRVIHRKAVLLASKSKASPLKRAPEAARQSTEPVKKQQRPVIQRATPLPTKPSSVAKPVDKAREIAKRRRLQEEMAQARGKCKIEETKEEVQERRRRMEEMARAREEFRRLVLAMEMAAVLDETVYRHELEELGIAPFEYAVTRTWSQAQSQDRILMEKAFEEAKPVIAALKDKGVCFIGAAGYCWGAKVVVELSKVYLIRAAVLLHPTFVTVNDMEEVRCPISVLGAEIDKISPPELVKQFEKVLSTNSGVGHFVKIFPGTRHGWSVRYRHDDVFAVKRAEEALADMIGWFNKNLKLTLKLKPSL